MYIRTCMQSPMLNTSSGAPRNAAQRARDLLTWRVKGNRMRVAQFPRDSPPRSHGDSGIPNLKTGNIYIRQSMWSIMFSGPAHINKMSGEEFLHDSPWSHFLFCL